jgi:hypothetical protein
MGQGIRQECAPEKAGHTVIPAQRSFPSDCQPDGSADGSKLKRFEFTSLVNPEWSASAMGWTTSNFI